MKFRIASVLVGILVAFGSACAGGNGDMTPQQVKKKMAQKGVVVIDVRTPQEWQQGHLKGAVHSNVFDEDFDAKIRKLKPSATYIVYCKSGGRSAGAVERMKKAGLKRVHNMIGGYMEWMALGYPIVR